MLLYRFRPRWSRLHGRELSTATQLRNALDRGAPIDIHPEVEDALASNKPVVALETTVITHGIPQPHNYTLGRSLENTVRSSGSIPATIGMIGGRVKIGLEEHELRRLAERTYQPVKLSRRDIAAAIAMKADGGTTCSATLVFAALANIKVFSTGGLGGVHRGGENSMDISADLGELTRSPVALVSAGVKSILDIGRKESLGVPVISYSDSREFPAFFSRHSGFDAPWNVSNPLTAAKILYTQWQLGMNNGALIAVPIPEDHEKAGSKIQEAVDQAVAESDRNGINKRGKEVTPWLLKRVSELTNETSLASNIALLENTARVGGQIAVQYQRLIHGEKESISTAFLPIQNQIISRKEIPIDKLSRWSPTKLAVIGSSAVDITAKAMINSSSDLGKHSTTPGRVSLTLGGVARNIAEAAHRVMVSAPQTTEPPLLISQIGSDSFARLLKSEMQSFGMRTDGLLESEASQRTAVCSMLLDNQGELFGGIADMDVTEALTPEQILPVITEAKPDIIALDGNLSSSTLTAFVAHCADRRINVFFEPTSVIKSTRILPAIASCQDNVRPGSAPITFASPNLLELSHMYQAARSEPSDLMSHSSWWSSIDRYSLGSAYRADLEQLAKRPICDEGRSKGTLSFLVDEGTAQMAINLLPFFQHLIIKCGARGILVAMRIPGPSAWSRERSNIFKRYIVAQGDSGSATVLQHFPVHPLDNIVNVTGAGDSFVGALLALLVQQPDIFNSHSSLQRAINASQQAAKLTLQSHLAVSSAISHQDINGSY